MAKNKSLHPRKIIKNEILLVFSVLAPRHVLRSAKRCCKRGMILNKLTRRLGLQRMILDFSPFLEPAHDTPPIERTQNQVK